MLEASDIQLGHWSSLPVGWERQVQKGQHHDTWTVSHVCRLGNFIIDQTKNSFVKPPPPLPYALNLEGIFPKHNCSKCEKSVIPSLIIV